MVLTGISWENGMYHLLEAAGQGLLSWLETWDLFNTHELGLRAPRAVATHPLLTESMNWFS